MRLSKAQHRRRPEHSVHDGSIQARVTRSVRIRVSVRVRVAASPIITNHPAYAVGLSVFTVLLSRLETKGISWNEASV